VGSEEMSNKKDEEERKIKTISLGEMLLFCFVIPILIIIAIVVGLASMK